MRRLKMLSEADLRPLADLVSASAARIAYEEKKK